MAFKAVATGSAAVITVVSMHRLVAVLLALLVGCGGDPDPKASGPRAAVSGAVDLEKPRAGAPDAGTSAGHGNEAVVARTSADVFSFTGRIKPADSQVSVSDGVVRVEPSGRFTVATASPAEGAKELEIEATTPGRRPWSMDVRVMRTTPTRVQVSERDDEAPSAAVMLEPAGGGPAAIQPSPSRAGERPDVVTLAQPGFHATAAVRDSASGTGRIRLIIESSSRCGADERRKVQIIPPAQIVNIAIPPGASAPVERQRTKTVRFDVEKGCEVSGEVFAEGTDAHGRQAVTAHVGFKYP